MILAPVLLLIDLVTGNFSQLASDAANIWNNIRNTAAQVWTAIRQTAVDAANALKQGADGAFLRNQPGFEALLEKYHL